MVQTSQTPSVLPAPLLELPEPFESKLRRCGVEPWMVAAEDADYRAGVDAIGAVRAFELFDAVDFQQRAPFGHRKVFDFLYDVEVREVLRYSHYHSTKAGQILYDRATNAYQLVIDRRDTLARSIARGAVAKLQSARARRAARKART